MADDPAWCKAITAPTHVQHHEDTCIFIEPVRHSACQHSNTRGPGPQHAQSKWWKVEDSLPNERMTVVHILANTSITSGNTCCTHASIASGGNICSHASITSGNTCCTHAYICTHAIIANSANGSICIIGLHLPCCADEVALCRLPSVRRKSCGSFVLSTPVRSDSDSLAVQTLPETKRNPKQARPSQESMLSKQYIICPSKWRHHVDECPNL